MTSLALLLVPAELLGQEIVLQPPRRVHRGVLLSYSLLVLPS